LADLAKALLERDACDRGDGMTAIIVLRDESAAHVLTDAAMVDADGRLIGQTSKVIALPHLNAVITARGTELFLPIIWPALSLCASTYDELRERVASVTREEIASAAAQNVLRSSPHGANFDLVIAGISSSGRTDSFLICNHSHHRVPPWTPVDLGEFAMLPGDARMLAEVHARPPERLPSGDIDVGAFGRRVMEIQRREPHRHESGKSYPNIGGFIQLTTVTAATITTRVVHRWPDEIDQPLGAALSPARV
jgi:hypothetical protein